MTDASQSPTRQRFEAWAKAAGYAEWGLEPDDGGSYVSGTMTGLWNAWQAALSSTPQGAAEPTYLIRAKFADNIEVYLDVTGVHQITAEKIGIDVTMPDYCDSPVAALAPQGAVVGRVECENCGAYFCCHACGSNKPEVHYVNGQDV